MGNAETSLRRHSESHQVSSSPNHPHHPAVERSLSESQSAAATTPQSIEASPKRHPAAAHRSNSVPAQRYRLDSSGSHYSYSAYSSSLEGGYADHGDGLQPRTFGGDYHKAVPRIKDNAMDFDAAHGHKLRMPIDSKQGSGFDLDWQYDSKKRNRVIKQRSLNPDHPLYHRLTPKIVEEGANAASSSTRGRVQFQS